MPIVKKIQHISNKIVARIKRNPDALPGSPEWLMAKEFSYGGEVNGVKRNKVSKHDPRSAEEIQTGGMTGGDRMSSHGYAKLYAQWLQPFAKHPPSGAIAEFGILEGSGLAIWCDLFPKNRVLGFDIDLGHTQRNLANLRSLGAFQHNTPELHEFDQFIDNAGLLDSILRGNKLSIVIDDGHHSDHSIITTIRSVMPHLADSFVYFIEDNATVHELIRCEYPELSQEHHGEMTILRRD